MKSKLLQLSKTLLVVVCLLVGVSSAWAYTPVLTKDYKVAGYKVKAYYDISNTNVDNMCPTEGDLCFRGVGYGLYNYGSGNRGADVTLSVSNGDLLLAEFKDSQGRGSIINSISNSTKNENFSSGDIWAFDVNADATTLNINVGRAGCIIAFLVMEKDASVATAEYTINYLLDGEPVKTTKGEGAVGSTINTDASFFAGDVKYFRADGERESVTIAANNNVFNINVRLAKTYNYEINAVDQAGNVIKNLKSISGFEGDILNIYIPKAFTQDDIIYETAETTYRVTVDGTDNIAKNFTYTESNITYFFEETDFTLSRSFAATIEKDFFSNGWGGRLYSNSYGYTKEIEGGCYKMEVAGCINTQTPTMTYGYRLNGENVVLGETETFANGNYAHSKTIENIVIPEGASFCWMNNTIYNSNLYIDYVALTKISTVEVTIAAGKEFATFNSEYALDFTNVTDLTAYTAKLNASTVTLTKVEEAVPFQTGLLIRRASKENMSEKLIVNVPVADSATDPDNDFVAVTKDGEKVTDGYVLATVNEVQGFYRANAAGTPIAKGKAYLPANGSESRLTMVFDDETTGINETVVNKKQATGTYNLNGQRVEQPTKGLYIVNGKKVVIK